MGHTQGGKSLGSPTTFVDHPWIWGWTQDKPNARAYLKGIRIAKYPFKIWISFKIEIYMFNHWEFSRNDRGLLLRWERRCWFPCSKIFRSLLAVFRVWTEEKNWGKLKNWLVCISAFFLFTLTIIFTKKRTPRSCFFFSFFKKKTFPWAHFFRDLVRLPPTAGYYGVLLPRSRESGPN